MDRREHRNKRRNKLDRRRSIIKNKMPSIIKTTGVLAGLIAAVSALPAQPKLSTRQNSIYELAKRQNAAAAALGLADVDILQL